MLMSTDDMFNLSLGPMAVNCIAENVQISALMETSYKIYHRAC